MNSIDRVREIFGRDRFATEATGVNIISVGDHTSLCTLQLGGCHCNARGVAMGGVVYTMADFAAAIAANSEDIESGDLHWVSLDSSIHYLAAAPMGVTLMAKTHAFRHGSRTALYQTIIENSDNGKCIAIVETTFIRVDKV
jgi:acyl-CoA thioesterase